MKTLNSLFYYTLATLMLKGASAILLPIYTRYMSVEDYGRLNLLVSFSAFFSLVLVMGVGELVFRSQANSTESPAQVCSRAFKFSLTVSCVFVVVALISLPSWINLLPFEYQISELSTLVVTVAISNLFTVPYCYLRASDQAKRYCLLALSHGLTQSGLILTVLLLGYGLLAVLLCGLITSTAVLIVIAFKGRNVWIKTSHSLSRREMIFLANILLSSLVIFGFSGAENWFIAYLFDEQSLANYFIATQAAILLAFLIEPVKLWWFARRYKVSQENPAVAAKNCVAIVQLGMVIALATLFCYRPVFDFLLPAAYQQSGLIFVCLLPSFILRLQSDVLNLGVYSKGNANATMPINCAAIAVLVVSLVLSYQVFALYAVALSIALAMFVRALLMLYVSQQRQFIPYNYHRLLACYGVFSTAVVLELLALLNWVVLLGLFAFAVLLLSANLPLKHLPYVNRLSKLGGSYGA
jgi:O-antigen/teichoic acid export membrane protein